MTDLDDVVCPACMERCNVESDEDGVCATCPACDYEMSEYAPTLRQMLDGVETGAVWNDVDLPTWTRMIRGLSGD